MAGEERLLALCMPVTMEERSMRRRLTDGLLFRPRYGLLVLTNHRLAYIREFPSGKVKERTRRLGIFSEDQVIEGLEDYSPQDLMRDLPDRANAEIPLTTILRVEAIGRNEAALELEASTERGVRRVSCLHVKGLTKSYHGVPDPILSGKTMAPVAEAIQLAMAGEAWEPPLYC